MNVALLSPCFWPEVRRGTERFARLLADGLIARGHDVTLITSHPSATTRAVEDGLRIVRLRRPPGGARLSRRMWEDHLLHVPLSYLELRRGDYDVAHALYPTDALAAARWSAETGLPAVHSFMGIPHRQGLANRRGRVEIVRRAIAGTRATVALSEAAREGFARWLGVEARVINPGVDLRAFTPDDAARAPAPTIFTAAAIGEPRKRVDLLLRAFALLRERRPDAQLVLSRPRGATRPAVGGVPEDKGARPLWRHGVQFVDVDDTAALAAAYRAAWVTALPSIGEAFGLVLVESLACGTPVVATDEGGMREVVGDRPEIARLFSGDDPAALAAALDEALDLKDSKACRARAEDFPAQRTADAYIQLYRELE
jgi:glycosyltransferase involved in cell wall biosynthesis